MVGSLQEVCDSITPMPKGRLRTTTTATIVGHGTKVEMGSSPKLPYHLGRTSSRTGAGKTANHRLSQTIIPHWRRQCLFSLLESLSHGPLVKMEVTLWAI